MLKNNKLFKLLNCLTMAQKLILIFLVCVLLPLVTQHLVYFGDIENNIQKELQVRLETSLAQRASSMNGIFSAVSALTLRYATDEALYATLDREYQTELDYLIAYQEFLKPALQLDPTYRQVGSIIVYTNNQSVFSGATVRVVAQLEPNLSENLVDLSWEPFSKVNSNIVLRVAQVVASTTAMSDRTISLMRTLNHYPQHSKYQKMLRIDLNMDEVSAILSNRELMSNMLLVDQYDRVLAASTGYATTGPFPHFSQASLGTNDIALTAPLKDVPSLKLVGIFNGSLFEDAMQAARTRTLLITSSMLLVAIIAIAIIARSITIRLKIMTEQANEIAKGNFSIIDENALGTDEIALLAKSSNRMAEDLQESIEREYDARLRQTRLVKEQTQAKLQALQSQVDPHFMFNALESIRLKAMLKSENETAQMIKYMSRMFRHLIDWEEDIILLKDDLKFLKEYLAIQQYRYDDDFAYSLTVADEAMDCYLPKLLIQPIVENACVHGVEAATGRREVHLNIAISGDMLLILINDNGTGIEEKQLQALKNMLAGGEKLKGSVGLYNVCQRLQLYYGDGYVFDVSSRLGTGTAFYLTIPFRCERSAFDVSDSDRG